MKSTVKVSKEQNTQEEGQKDTPNKATKEDTGQKRGTRGENEKEEE